MTCILFLLDSHDLAHDKPDKQLPGMRTKLLTFVAHTELGEGLNQIGFHNGKTEVNRAGNNSYH